MKTPFDHAMFKDRAAEIVAATREFAALGWTPATGGNFSMRLDDRHAAITVSGRDKGRLSEADVMTVLESGELKGRKIGATWRIPRAAISTYLS